MPPKIQNILTEAQKAKRMAEIKTLFKDFLKVIKVVSMYPEGNPLPAGMRRSFAERLSEHIEEYGSIQIQVNRDTLVCDGETVFIDKTKEESLAALFFDTGITSFTFQESFDVESGFKLLDMIKAYVNSGDKSVDLAGLIWESGINRFVFSTLEDIALAEYQGDFNVRELDGSDTNSGQRVVLFGTDQVESYEAIFKAAPDGDSDSSEKLSSLADDSDSGPKISFQGGRRTPGASGNQLFYAVGTGQGDNSLLSGVEGVDAISFKAAEAAEAMGLDNLPVSSSAPRVNTTLILNDELRLSEEDEQAVRELSERDGDFDMWEATTELCKEMLHQDTDLPDFSETVTICSKVATEFLHAGKLWHAVQLLQYIALLEDKIRSGRPVWADKLKEVRMTFGSRERMEILGETLNLHPEIGAEELRKYLNFFDWQALGAVTDLLGDVTSEVHREAICDFLTTIGKTHLQILSRGVTDKRPEAVRGAIIVLSRIGDPSAFSILKRAAENEDRSVRLELVTQLRNYAGPEALDILKMAATDRDHEIRIAAISSLATQQGPAAFDAVEQILAEKAFFLLESEDKERILIAYSTLGGEAAVNTLSQMIRRYNPLRNPILAAVRKSAFAALAHNQSDSAGQALVRFANSWRPNIRQQAQTALKRRRELLFGGTHE